MKLRCTTNSVRIRIRRSELDLFDREGRVAEQVYFPGGSILTFALERISGAAWEATLTDGTLRIGMPEAQAEIWMNPDRVGFEEQLPVAGKSATLHLLIEKDFPCLHRTNEDKTDTFQDLADRS